MITNPWFWRATAAVFTIINVGGAVYAAAMAEPGHAGVHVALLVLGFAAYLVWRPKFLGGRRAEVPEQLGAERLDYLQQSVDAIALEVERIGEKQRFSERLRAEQAGIAPGAGSSPKEPPR